MIYRQKTNLCTKFEPSVTSSQKWCHFSKIWSWHSNNDIINSEPTFKTMLVNITNPHAKFCVPMTDVSDRRAFLPHPPPNKMSCSNTQSKIRLTNLILAEGVPRNRVHRIFGLLYDKPKRAIFSTLHGKRGARLSTPSNLQIRRSWKHQMWLMGWCF